MSSNTRSLFFSMSRLSTLAFLILMMCSCGNQQTQDIVKSVILKTYMDTENNNDIRLQVGGVFNLGEFSFGSYSIPIVNPRDFNQKFGDIILRQGFDGTNEMIVDANISSIAKIFGSSPKMPNGSDIPVGGIDRNNIIALDLDKFKSKVFFTLTEKSTMAGVAIVISQFSNIGDRLGKANVFPAFTYGGVKGIVGIFTGDSAEKNGLGFFVDLSSVITTEILNKLIRGETISESEFQSFTTHQKKVNSMQKSQLTFKYHESHPDKTKEVVKESAEIMRKGGTLELE